jgi:hypothetical protein
MIRFGALHPGEDQLLRFADGELRPREAAAIRAHLEACWGFRAQLEELARGIRDYVRYQEAVLKPNLPPPPRPWADIRVRMERFDQPRAIAPSRAPRRWLSAAAVVLLACLAAYRFGRPPAVSAAELLRKAVAVDSSTPREHRQIRVRTRTRSFTRPAVHTAETASGAAPVEALFAAARFNWEDPLSARSYAAWREQLPEKRDEVEPVGAPDPSMYRIRTTTAHSVLTEATITLRAQDLAPLSETFQFRGSEWVEITAVPGEPVVPSPEAPAIAQVQAPEGVPRPAAPPQRVETDARATQELQVIAALHQIGADLGEPIELSRSGRQLVVTGTGIEPQRQEQVRSSLARLSGVAVRFDDPQPLGPDADAARAAMSVAAARVPLQAEMEKAVGGRVAFEKFAARALDLSEVAMSRAHALRNLAQRFPAAAESQLGEGDRSLLATLRREHAQALAGTATEIVNTLMPALTALGAGELPAPGDAALRPDWQAGSGQVFAAAQEADQLLNVLLAGADTRLAPAEIPARLTHALARFRARAAAYRDTMRESTR